jgi:hypothetical protein
MNAGKDDDDPSGNGKSSQSSAGFERYVSIAKSLSGNIKRDYKVFGA